MIRKFSVENYRNFKEKICLDFSNVRDYSFNTFCQKNGLISKIIMYGENGVGKSNLGFALFDIVSVLTDRHITDEIGKKATLFLNADSDEKEATFHYEFDINGHELQYEYCKSDYNKLVSEKLMLDNSVVFSYDFEHKTFIEKDLDKIGANSLNFEFYENESSVLRYIANNGNIAEMQNVKELMQFVSRMLWFRSLDRNQYIGLNTKSRNFTEYIVEKNLLSDFNVFLNRVTGKNYKLISYADEVTGEQIILEEHRKRKINFFNAASNGTRTLTLFYYWLSQFKEASFVWMDEFDAFYHFELSEKVIREIIPFENVQFVVTTHNTYLLSNSLLRPDAYLILRNGKVRNLPDSTFRELREGHNLEKLFRNGDFEDE